MQTQQQAPLVRERPCGVMLIAIFQVIQGIFLIIAGFLGIRGIVVVFLTLVEGVKSSFTEELTLSWVFSRSSWL